MFSLASLAFSRSVFCLSYHMCCTSGACIHSFRCSTVSPGSIGCVLVVLLTSSQCSISLSSMACFPTMSSPSLSLITWSFTLVYFVSLYSAGSSPFFVPSIIFCSFCLCSRADRRLNAFVSFFVSFFICALVFCSRLMNLSLFPSWLSGSSTISIPIYSVPIAMSVSSSLVARPTSVSGISMSSWAFFFITSIIATIAFIVLSLPIRSPIFLLTFALRPALVLLLVLNMPFALSLHASSTRSVSASTSSWVHCSEFGPISAAHLSVYASFLASHEFVASSIAFLDFSSVVISYVIGAVTMLVSSSVGV